MLGLQGKSAKPAPRATSVSKSARPSASTMATASGNGIRSRASSSASEKPERLSLTHKGPSPYSSQLTTPGSNAGRRVQSAATTRQKSALGGPTVKASEFFRKNHSEPQLGKVNNSNSGKSGTTNVNFAGGKTRDAKTVKHVRIDTESGSLKTTLNTAANLLGIQGSNTFNQGGNNNRRRPFSFSSDRSRSISVASNDSCSTLENELLNDGGSGDGGDIYWRKDLADNNNRSNRTVNFPNQNADTSSTVSSDSQKSIVSTGKKGDFHTQRIEMKIAEHPEETLNEKNMPIKRIGPGSARGNFTKAFREDGSGEPRKLLRSARGFSSEQRSQSDFDRLLFKQSDDLLQGVSDLINEIKSTEAKKKDELSEPRQDFRMVDDRLNFSTLTISGTELSDITCPAQVMEQSESVPNTGRTERPLSAVVLEALSIIEQRANSARSQSTECGNNSARAASASSQHGEVDMTNDEIQQKIRSALQLLEEEDQKFRNGNSARRGSITPRHDAGMQLHSPYTNVSNSDSRPASVGEIRHEDGCKLSPRMRSDYEGYNSHPMRHQSGGSSGILSSQHNEERHTNAMIEPQSARSCSCLLDHHVSNESSLNSARSSKTTTGIYQSCSDAGRHNQQKIQRTESASDRIWEAKDDKTKQIFSFLDEVEKSDQEMLFGLRFETDCLGRPKGTSSSTMLGASTNEGSLSHSSAVGKKGSNDDRQHRSMDSLIRKGSVELAREILLLERKLEEAQHSIKLLEESLLTQRDLNIRTLRNTERDFKKRMKMQKEEFDQIFARNEALVNEMATEKRVLQDKFDKLIKNFEEMEEKHKEHVKSIQQKHLDEIRRLRKMQQNAENSLKKNIAGNKAQASEIREMTVKGLEPEVQRIIQRHQQEMSEMRAWHADEVREIEERYQRKLHMQLEDLRQKFAKEKEDAITKERELINRRIQAELKQRDDEIESLKRRHTNELFEERERAVSEETKLKESIQESVRKAQIKAELELENLKQEYETKLANLERRHESEIKSVKDVYEAERQNWATNQVKKLEQALAEQEAKLKEAFHVEKEREWREKERKLKEEFERFRNEDETAFESRFRRMQEKYQSELNEMEKTEKDVKTKFSQAKTDLLAREEEVFCLKTSISMKDKQLADLQDMNVKMQEERVNLTSVIRKEFTDQIHAVEEECRSLKASIVEVQANAKLQIEQKQMEIEKIIAEKDSEIEKIGLRVKQALARKDETILELQKQFEKSSFEIRHLEELLEEQRKEFLHGMTKMSSGGGRGQKK